ncbi:MAG: hypothetical protein KKE44_12460 [Proteobacteria bacterium]|nr:hypothetical protein [Pseudomonadota bacterium]MBU1583539.1 hypothetical protein [Pseudomonadota bacterium]MBU2455058.1 hypothetical protein [Pseudomonadota bacterium]
MTTGIWVNYKPWDAQLLKEKHGEKMFNTGFKTFINTFPEQRYELIKDTFKPELGRLVTVKKWVYQPGYKRGTMIEIQYFEVGDHTNPVKPFLREQMKGLSIKW